MIKISHSLDVGILYVLEIQLEDKALVKIGITSKKIEDRVCGLLTSIWKKYRIFPQCYVKRFKKVDGYTSKEAELHKYFADRRYTTKHVFGGCTEFFDIPLDEVVEAYDRLVQGLPLVEETNAEDNVPECEQRDRGLDDAH
jgi:hypothetical protein